MNFTNFARKLVIGAMPRSYVLKRRLNDGIVFRGINKAGFGGRGVFLKGLDYEPELALLPSFLSKDSVFIDIGANSGVYSMVAAGILTNGIVISYEPFPLMGDYVLKNVLHNNLNNVRLRTFGISNETGSKKFYLNGGKPNVFSFSRNLDQAVSVELFTKTLDDAIKMEHLNRIDYIKIDAEGEEKKIIEGASNVIRRFQPIIQTEIQFGEIDAIDGYKIFSVANSVNKLYIPENSDKVKVARQLGLVEMDASLVDSEKIA